MSPTRIDQIVKLTLKVDSKRIFGMFAIVSAGVAFALEVAASS
jgi:hypothetical protein